MNLNPADVKHFYGVWLPAMDYVNRQKKIIPARLAKDPSESWDPDEATKLRDAMWADDAWLAEFISTNPMNFSPEQLAIVSGWRYRRFGGFYALRHLKKHTIFIAEKTNAVYAVVGLATPLEEMLPMVPRYMNTSLLPFGDHIIYDGLLGTYNISFGKGIRTQLEGIYKDAKERGAIITSLLPPEVPPGPEEQRMVGRSTNVKVLDAFRAHLFASRLSQKIVERDVENARCFGEVLLSKEEPASVRDWNSTDAVEYLAGLPEKRKRENATSLKRFVGFLRDTERMDYWTAKDVLERLKE